MESLLLGKLPLAPLFILLLLMEASRLLHVSVMNDLSYVELPHDLLILFLKGFSDQFMILVLDTPLVVDLLDYKSEQRHRFKLSATSHHS